jgi:hypothetical protein
MTTTPEQIEAVARAMCDHECGEGCWDDLMPHERQEYKRQVASAIAAMRPFIRAEVLEEAAKVADGYHLTIEVTRDLMDDGNITTTTVRSLANPLKIAAAIRALKEKP